MKVPLTLAVALLVLTGLVSACLYVPPVWDAGDAIYDVDEIEVGVTTPRAPILASVLEGFERRYGRTLRDGSATLLREWESLSVLPLGERLAVQGPSGRCEGLFTGLDEDGALILEGPGGLRSRVPFGELADPIRS